jgi:proteasome lid subunit RPN8/RPN11
VIVPRRVREAIAAHARAAAPQECCGLLVGSGEGAVTVHEAVPTANVADDPQRRFAIDPQAHFNLLRRLRGGPTAVVGHYHSHPEGPVAPSRHDLAMAHDPWALWLIAAVHGGQVALSAYRADSGGSRFVPVEMADEA